MAAPAPAAAGSSVSKRFHIFISNVRTPQDTQALQLAMMGPPAFRAQFAVYTVDGSSGIVTPLLQDNVHQRRTRDGEETLFQLRELIQAFVASVPATGGAGGPTPPTTIAAQAQQALARASLLRGMQPRPGMVTSAPAADSVPTSLQIGSLFHSGIEEVSFRSAGGMGMPGGTQSRFTGGGLMTIGAISGVSTTFESASNNGITLSTAEQISADPVRRDRVRAQATADALSDAFAPIAAHLPDGKFSDKSLGPARETDIIAARDKYDAELLARLPPPTATEPLPALTDPFSERGRRGDYVPQAAPF